ncbi:MAG TPA: 50S ribosomal protein L21 [Candidatus Paceibacterota bacterium]
MATGGKQYKVREGDNLKIEKITGDFKEGDKITFDNVLLTDYGTSVKIGEPVVSGAKVTATLNKISRYPKVLVIKYKQKSRYYKKNTHRQPYFEVKIDSLT